MPRGFLHLLFATQCLQDQFGVREEVGLHQRQVSESSLHPLPTPVTFYQNQREVIWLPQRAVPRPILPNSSDPSQSWSFRRTTMPIQYKKEGHNTDKDKYTIRTKTIDPKEHTTNLETPGPAAYQSIELENSTGRHHVSKFVDSKLGTIEGKIKRFPALKRTPGPTTYNPHESVIESRYQKIGIRGMDK